jgi:hypothetical protein
MNELNTYQNLAGKVLKSATNKKNAQLTSQASISFTQAKLQELLDQDDLDNLIKSLLKCITVREEQDVSLQVFYQKFTEILLHLIAETKFAKNISISSDEFLEIIRVSLEEQINSLSS